MFGRREIVIILLLLTGSVSFAQQKWSIEECIGYALKNNLDIISRRIASEANKEILAQSKRNRLPYIDAGTNYNVNFGKSVDPNTNDVTYNNFASNRYSLSGSVSLFDGFIRNNQIAYNRFIYRAGLAKEETQKIEIAFAVMNAFHNLVYYEIESYCQELSATSAEYLQAKKQTESNELAFEVAQKKKEQGLTNILDFYMSKNLLSNAQSELLRTKLQYIIKRKTIDFYMGKPVFGINEKLQSWEWTEK